MSNPTELPGLDKLEALARAATPGPWDVNQAAAMQGGRLVVDELYVYSPEMRNVAIAADIADPVTGEMSKANADFIAAANPAAVLTLIALARRPPVPAQRPTDDELWDSTIRDRDTYHEWADKLAGAIAVHFGVDIGEHSNQNCPWHEALEAIESAEPARRAQPEGERDKLLRIIAYTYQIAGAHGCPEHILDVLSDPEAATDEQIESLLPYQPEGEAPQCSIGVGDGSGRLFVRGDYESIKAVQRIILENDSLRAAQQAAAHGNQPDQVQFEAQAKYQGATDFTLVHPDFARCNNGWEPATYRDPMTELAWRVWANKRVSPSAPGTPEAPADLPRLYRFDCYVGKTKMAAGVGVHATSMEEAEQKARKLADKEETIKFDSNQPCHASRKCSICAAYERAAQLNGGQGEAQ